jgi:hypothetical protein
MGIESKHIPMDSIIASLKSNISSMVNQDWIAAKNSYEAGFCSHLPGWEEQTGRFWDCVTPEGVRVELKKGLAAMWFDEVRYSELLLKKTPEAQQDTITLFIEYKMKPVPQVVRILVIDSKRIIEALGITEEWAECVTKRFATIKRGMNCQQSMTKKDMTAISSAQVLFEGEEEPRGPPADLPPPPTPEQAKENRRLAMERLNAKRAARHAWRWVGVQHWGAQRKRVSGRQSLPG